MSKLEKLIKELCPDVVEYKTLGEVCNYERPEKYIVSNTNYNDSFTIPVLTAGRTFILGYTNETEGIYNASKENPVIIFDDFTGALKWVDFRFKVKSSAMKMIKTNENIAKMRYVFYCMENLNFFSDEHKRLWIATYSQFSIPVPPLPVQEEIVRILDTFTQLTAELTAELTERRRQYEYYRDALLTRETKAERKKLGDVCQKTENIDWKKNKGKYQYIDLTSVDRETHAILETAAINSSNAPSRARQIVKENDVLFGTTRPMLKRTAFVTKEFDNQICSTGYCVLRANTSTVLPRYIYHQICSQMFYQYVELHQKGASYPAISDADVKDFEIPLPPLDVQERLVRVLDNFDSICSDLNIGLPAEIEARKKQYEFYRDSLLTFAESGRIAADSIGGGYYYDLIRIVQYVFGYAPVRLGEIATDIFRGSGIKRDQITEDGIPCVRYGEIYTTYGVWFDKCKSHTELSKISNPKYFEHGDILFAITGESVDDIAKSTAYMGNEKCIAGGDIVVLRHNQNPKFMAYALSTSAAQAQKSKGKIKSKVVHSSIPAICEIEIPLPDLDEQKRIAEILDRFDALCNDISQGLPAEIEARRKQYEHYRDKLLAFREKNPA